MKFLDKMKKQIEDELKDQTVSPERIKYLTQLQADLQEGEKEIEQVTGELKKSYTELLSDYRDLAKNQVFGQPSSKVDPNKKDEANPKDIAKNLGLELDL